MQKSGTKNKGTALGRTVGRTKKRAIPAPAKKTAMAQASSVPANMTENAAPRSSERLADGSRAAEALIVKRESTGVTAR